MTPALFRLSLVVALALCAFAGNSLLTRAALSSGDIGPDSFTAIRLVAGAMTLLAIGFGRRLAIMPRGSDVPGVIALFVYAAAFSRAYVSLTAATGAIILFTAVQVTVIAGGAIGGGRIRLQQGGGVLIALGGLAWLLAPGLSAPPLTASIMMATAGIAWGSYTLLGRGAGAPVARTARNFIGTVPLAIGLVAVMGLDGTPMAILLAIASGAITCQYQTLRPSLACRQVPSGPTTGRSATR